MVLSLSVGSLCGDQGLVMIPVFSLLYVGCHCHRVSDAGVMQESLPVVEGFDFLETIRGMPR